jgi:hypothetical protein
MLSCVCVDRVARIVLDVSARLAMLVLIVGKRYELSIEGEGVFDARRGA